MKKVLIVDDEMDTRNLIKKLLEDDSFQVYTAKDGKEGISSIKKTKFDLVLIDMFMPGMSGREMCERIKNDAKTKRTRFAFLTVAQFGEQGKEELKRLGSLDYIQKPIDNENFIKRIRKIVKRKA